MPDGTIDQLLIEIKGTSNSVSKAIDKLSASLQGLYKNIDISTLDKFNTSLSNIVSSAKDVTKSLKKVSKVDFSKTNSGLSKMGSSLNSISGFLLGGINFTYLTGAFKDAMKVATSYFETLNYFQVAMGQYTVQAYKYAQKVSDLLGIDEEQWMNNQATFMSLAATFGNTADNAYLMSKNLTQLVYDLSSLKNVKADVAMQKLRSAFAGEIEPLRDWGVDLSKANLQLVALEHNITKPFDQMTQAEKSQLRYVTIMNQLEYAMGDLSKTLTQPANQLRVLEASITKCARALGNIFIPILNAIIPMLISFAKIIRLVFEQIAALFGFEYPEVTNWDRYTDSVGALSDNLDDATGSAKALKKQLAGFDEINNLTTNQGSGSGNDIGGGFGGLDLPTYESLGKDFIDPALEERITKITDKIKELIPWLVLIGTTIMVWKGYFAALNLIPIIMQIFEWIKKLWVLIAANPIVAVIALIVGIIAALVTAYKTNDTFREKVDKFVADAKVWLATTWEKIKTFFTNISDKAKKTWENIKNFFAKMPAWFAEKWNAVKEKASAVWQAIKDGASAAWDRIKQKFQNMGTWFAERWQAIKTKAADSWASLKKGASDAWEGIKEKFSKIPEWFKEKFTSAWEKVKNVFSAGGEIFSDIKEGLSNAFSNVLEKLRMGFNSAIAKPFEFVNKVLNKLRDISFLGISPFKNLWGYNPISVPYIPRLATGGVVTAPTTALVGENGPEAIVPLENNTEWINKVASQINSGNDNAQVLAMLDKIIVAINDIDLDVTIGDKEIYNANKRETNKQSRLLGRAY